MIITSLLHKRESKIAFDLLRTRNHRANSVSETYSTSAGVPNRRVVAPKIQRAFSRVIKRAAVADFYVTPSKSPRDSRERSKISLDAPRETATCRQSPRDGLRCCRSAPPSRSRISQAEHVRGTSEHDDTTRGLGARTCTSGSRSRAHAVARVHPRASRRAGAHARGSHGLTEGCSESELRGGRASEEERKGSSAPAG